MGGSLRESMKQFILLILLTTAGAIGAQLYPFYGVLLYYTIVALRPQELWDWALPHEIRWSLLAGVAMIAAVIVNAPRVLRDMRFNIVMALMVAFAALMAASVFMAYDAETAQYWGMEYAKVLLAALIAGAVITRIWQVAVLALAVLAGVGYIAWEINSLYFFDGRLDVYHRGFGGLDNNGAGLMIAIALPLAYTFATAAPRLWQRAAAGLLGLVMLHAIMMTYSRGAMVAALAGIAWAIVHHRSWSQRLLIAGALAMAIPFLAGDEIRDRFFSTAEWSDDRSAQIRFEAWSAAVAIANEHPFGVGVRNSPNLIQHYGGDVEGRAVHSQYLQIAADSGYPAMVVYLALLAAAFLCLRRARAICLKHADACFAHHGKEDPEGLRAWRGSVLFLGFETGLIIFAIGASFLSIEVLELPWMMMAIAGIAPRAARALCGGAAGGEARETPALLRSARPSPFWQSSRITPPNP